jgi:hypothetical protein
MSCNTGDLAALYLQATQSPPDDLDQILGDLWENVIDANKEITSNLARIADREKRFASNCPTTGDMNITLSVDYKRNDPIFLAVKDAVMDGTPVDVTMLTSKVGLYEGRVARFSVASKAILQPLEEGQTVDINLSIMELGDWLEGDHTPPEE